MKSLALMMQVTTSMDKESQELGEPPQQPAIFLPEQEGGGTEVVGATSSTTVALDIARVLGTWASRGVSLVPLVERLSEGLSDAASDAAGTSVVLR